MASLITNTADMNSDERLFPEGAYQNEERILEIINNMQVLQSHVEQMNKKTSTATVSELLTMVEQTLFGCGGDSKLTILEAGWNIIKVKSSVPITANLFAWVPDEVQFNKRFHRAVTDILVNSRFIRAIKWYPLESRESVLLLDIDLKGGTVNE